MISGVYCIRNKISGRRYVGSASDIAKRMRTHKSCLNRSIHENGKLQKAWDKYGCHAFDFFAVLYCSKGDILMYEQLVIDYYQSVSRGYNICAIAGNCSGVKLSASAKKKLSEHWKGKKKPPFSAEHRAKLAAAQRGKKASDETRAKMSAAHKGKKFSSETLLKLSKAARSRKPKQAIGLSAV